MTPERWRLVREILGEALERPAEEREAFLEARCAGDEQLRAEVESLLAAHAEAAGRFGTGALQEALSPGALGGALAAGDRVGPYRVVRLLGSGGMGLVHLAERDDEVFRKRVALKVVQVGAGEEIVRRFEQERDILAALEHDSIAGVLDGGTTADGRPYLVMEYVEGEPIVRYCDRRRLGVEVRLSLFLEVCGAVAYAHRNLVVHRDLKPDNILVTPEGTPKLLDFGIAKLLGPELARRTLLVTQTGVAALTPHYASPEQVRGEAVTTATDVYALGVLLHELLVGSPPYELEGKGLAEVSRVICEEEPASPSAAVGGDAGAAADAEAVAAARATTPERLRRRLRGDLDTIVLKALRKEPERRYASAAELADDIRRHLDGHPVTARPDSLGYRAGRFVRRHRVGVAFAALILVALVAFAVAMTVQSARLAAERDRAEAALVREEAARHEAEREAAKAAAAKDFLEETLGAADPGRGATGEVTVIEALERGLAQVEERLAGQPEVLGEVLETAGEIYDGLGRFAEAEELYQRAVEVRREVYGDSHLEVAKVVHHLGRIRVFRGDYAEGERYIREALEILRDTVGESHERVAECHLDLAAIFRNRGDLEGTLRHAERSLAILREEFGEDHLRVAVPLSWIGFVRRERGELDAAEEPLRRSLEIIRRHHGDGTLWVAHGETNLGVLLQEKGDLEAAEGHFRRGLAAARSSVRDDHELTGRTLSYLGDVLREGGRLDEAEAPLREGVAIMERAVGTEHPDYGISVGNLAALHRDRGEYREAEALYERALSVFKDRWGEAHPEVAEHLHEVGLLHQMRGDTDRARTDLERALEIGRETLGESHPQVERTRQALDGLDVAVGSGR